MFSRAVTTAFVLIGMAVGASAYMEPEWPMAPPGAVVAMATLGPVRNQTKSHGKGVAWLVICGPSPVNGSVYMKLGGKVEMITMAHIHQRNADLNNPIRLDVLPRTPAAMPSVLDPPLSYMGELSFTSAYDGMRLARWGLNVSDFMGLLKRDKLYVNIHTAAYPGGEIQGMLKCKMPCMFPMM